MNKNLSFFLLLLFSTQCTQTNHETTKIDSNSSIQYAERFDIDYQEGYKIITIDKPWQGSKQSIRYLLYQDSIPKSYQNDNTFIKIKSPVMTIVSNLTTQLALMENLEVENRLIGFAQTQFIYSPNILEKVESGKIQEVGPDGSLDIESILNLNPDIVLAFSSGNENRQLQKLQELGVKVVMNAGYMETSVLGRFEWIKFLGHLFGEESRASEFFDEKVIVYDSLLQLVKERNRPSVITGTLYGGTWYMPAGKNYGANIIADAGGDYLWNEDEGTGWLSMDFESVFEKAYNADYWIGVASFESLNSILEADARYGDFKAFKEKNVYTNNWRKGAKGGSEFLELGYLRPDIILADLIKIMHPNTLPQHELYFHKQLE